MPTKPVQRTPSFIPSIYPYQITVTLSTSTAPSVLTLPRHQLLMQDEVDTKSRASEQRCTTREEVVLNETSLSKEKVDALPAPEVQYPNSTAEDVLLAPLGIREAASITIQNPPRFKSKSIYNQGQFKWSISFGVELLKVPPVSTNNAELSEGDIFIRAFIDDDDHTKKTKVWCLFATSSTSRLVWRAWEPLQDVRLISNIPYVLLLHDNYEPSWVLERSLARKRRKWKSGH